MHQQHSAYSWLEMLYRVLEKYQSCFGVRPLNVSHWDPLVGSHPTLRLPSMDPGEDVIDYAYSFDFEDREKLCSRLGFDPEGKFCLITPSGTVSMLCAVNLLARSH